MTLNIQSCLDQISEICAHYGIESLRPQLESAQALLGKESIDVAVLGRFKAGKSSFLNSLAKETLLPVGVIPVTAVITRLRFGPKASALVIFQDGRRTEIEPSTIKNYIAESENPNNKKSVAAVEIESPELKSFEGLEFVDTPGLGSALKHNTAVSLDWLPKVGVALVAIGVDPPLSEQDLELIKRLHQFTPRIAVLLTKTDLLLEPQLQEVLQFIDIELKKHFESSIPVFPYSTRSDLESVRKHFTDRVLIPLKQAKHVEAEQILQHKMKSILSECETLLEVSLRASERTHQEREEIKAQVLGEKLGIQSTLDELRMLTREWLGKTRPGYITKLTELQPDILETLQNELTDLLGTWQFNLYKLTRAYEDWVRKRFEDEIGSLSQSKKAMFLDSLQSAAKSITRATQSFDHRLTANVEESLGFKMKRPAFSAAVDNPRAPDVSIGRVFDSHLDQLWFLIPMFIFRRVFERHFLKQLPYEVEKNLSRLASQWTERVNSAIQKIGRQAEIYITSEVRTMEHLLAGAVDSTPEIRKHLENIRSMKSELLDETRNSSSIQQNQIKREPALEKKEQT